MSRLRGRLGNLGGDYTVSIGQFQKWKRVILTLGGQKSLCIECEPMGTELGEDYLDVSYGHTLDGPEVQSPQLNDCCPWRHPLQLRFPDAIEAST
jgi:hypothetical protein